MLSAAKHLAVRQSHGRSQHEILRPRKRGLRMTAGAVVAVNPQSSILNPQSRRAFTLLEVLVALALIAILSVSLYASLSIAFRARRSAAAATSQVRRADLAMELIAADIRSAVIPKGTGTAAVTGTAPLTLAGPFEGDDSTDNRGRESDTVTFCCTTPSPEPKELIGDIRQVQFVCEPSADGRSQVLTRLVTTNLLSPTAVQPQREVLCRGVNSFSLLYFDGTAWWNTWDSTTVSNALPYVVQVTLELVDEQQKSRDAVGYRTLCLLMPLCAPTPTSGITGTISGPSLGTTP